MVEIARRPAEPTAQRARGAPAELPAAAPVERYRPSVQLAAIFRAAFGLAPDVDVSYLGVGAVQQWDSRRGHLELMKEVEQALRMRLPADARALI